MFTGINLHETKKYISKNDPNQENPTIFHLGTLDTIVSSYIEDNSTKFDISSPDPEADANIHILFATRNLLIVKFGVKKIENFMDPETKQPGTIESEKVYINGKIYLAIPDKALAMLPRGNLVNELAAEILKLNSLSQEEAKN